MNTWKRLLPIALVCLAGCTDRDPEAKGELSEFAQEFLNLRMGASTQANKSADAAINRSFQSMMGFRPMGGRIAGDSSGTSDPSPGDTTLYPTEPWVSCAKTTTIINEDGSTTTIVDYGDGCNEGVGDYTYFVHGKYTQTYAYRTEWNKSVRTDYYSFDILYDNFGGDYGSDSTEWSLDGDSFYDGYSTFDTLTNKFSGTNSYQIESVSTFAGATFSYKANSKSHYDEKGIIIDQNEYEYGDADNYYHSRLLNSQVYNYQCNSNASGNAKIGKYIWVAVSGKEEVSYVKDGKAGSFVIDYGNGECDNIIYVTENGVTVEVDLGDAGFCVM